MLPLAVIAIRHARRRSALPRVLVRVARWCALCHARAAQRRNLAALDERMLKDVGLTPGEAARECAKPWWRG